MKRICSVCKEEKNLEDFYRNKIEKLGREYRCKLCSAKKCKRYFEKKINQDPDYYKKEALRNRENSLKWRKKTHFSNKKKIYARSYIGRMIEEGKLIRPEYCSECKCNGIIQAHHEDYDKPSEIVWLCTKCHKQADKARVRREIKK